MTIRKTIRIYECDACHRQATVEGTDDCPRPDGWIAHDIVLVKNYGDGLAYHLDLCSMACYTALQEQIGRLDSVQAERY